jgi:hypothetical protein
VAAGKQEMLWAAWRKVNAGKNLVVCQFPVSAGQDLRCPCRVSKDNTAHAAYFANLMTGHQEIPARLTISIGGWGEQDNLAEGKWVFIEARPIPCSYEMMVREPEESLYSEKPILGRALTR